MADILEIGVMTFFVIVFGAVIIANWDTIADSYNTIVETMHEVVPTPSPTPTPTPDEKLEEGVKLLVSILIVIPVCLFVFWILWDRFGPDRGF